MLLFRDRGRQNNFPYIFMAGVMALGGARFPVNRTFLHPYALNLGFPNTSVDRARPYTNDHVTCRLVNQAQRAPFGPGSVNQAHVE